MEVKANTNSRNKFSFQWYSGCQLSGRKQKQWGRTDAQPKATGSPRALGVPLPGRALENARIQGPLCYSVTPARDPRVLTSYHHFHSITSLWFCFLAFPELAPSPYSFAPTVVFTQPPHQPPSFLPPAYLHPARSTFWSLNLTVSHTCSKTSREGTTKQHYTRIEATDSGSVNWYSPYGG